ncbi:MAG: pimeloyl-ACP methyl ester carboxylesterase [Candidatus Azotimanducaceae bacterium]|jgi:pimeloyl-ACP methyl ester carboxylesterase
MNITRKISTLLLAGLASTGFAFSNSEGTTSTENDVLFKTVEVNGVDIFYREAGSPEDPTILLLHGFPTSSHMFRELIEDLKGDYHLVAPDYPGFGNSEQPLIEDFEYTFDNFAKIVEQFTEELELDSYSLYLMDYGAPVGFRLAVAHPERVESLIIQNGNAYDEGLREFWDPIKAYWADRTAEKAEPLTGFITPDGVKWQYTHGVRDAAKISPDNWNNDLRHLTRAGNPEIQLQLFFDYGTNPGHYPAWQAYFREHQPPTLIVWGKNDTIFPAGGAFPYQRDLKNVDFHLLDTGHFALEEDGELIAQHIREFLPSALSQSFLTLHHGATKRYGRSLR